MVKKHTRGKTTKAVNKKAKKAFLKEKRLPSDKTATQPGAKGMDVEDASKLKAPAGLVDVAKQKAAQALKRKEARRGRKARRKARVGPMEGVSGEASAGNAAKPMASVVDDKLVKEQAALLARRAAEKAEEEAAKKARLATLSKRDRRKAQKHELKLVRTKDKIAHQSRSGGSSRGR